MTFPVKLLFSAPALITHAIKLESRAAAPSRFPYGSAARRAAARAFASASSLADIRAFNLATSAG